MIRRLVALVAAFFALGALTVVAAGHVHAPQDALIARHAPAIRLQPVTRHVRSQMQVQLTSFSRSSQADVGGGGASGSGRARSRCDFRCHAWRWARTQHGKPYVWGGTGPGGYDCSGLIYAAFLRWHHPVPRTTYDMLSSGQMYRVYRPKFGDVAFFGSGHVEFWDRRGYTFGAHHSGTLVGRRAYNSYYAPTEFMRIRR